MFSFNQWLRENKVAMWILTVLRVYIGYDWMTHGWGKLTGGFQAGGFLTGALGKATGENPAVQAWWATFLEKFAIPNAGLFDFLIPLGEFLVGLGLIRMLHNLGSSDGNGHELRVPVLGYSKHQRSTGSDGNLHRRSWCQCW